MSSRPTNRQLHRFWDNGTSYLCVSEQIVLEGGQELARQPELLHLQESQYEIPQTVGLVRYKDGIKFLWGLHMDEFLSSEAAYQIDNIPISNPKYLFYDTPAIKKIRREYEKELEGWLDGPDRLRQVVVMHFKELRKAALSASRDFWRGYDVNFNPDTVTTVDFFAVPDVLRESDRCHYVECLREAGFTRTRFISETESAAAYVLSLYRQFCTSISAATGDELIMADVGGGTINTSSFILGDIDPDPKGFQSAFRWTRLSESEMYGSEIATQRFYDHAQELLAREHGGSFEAGLEYLSMSRTGFHYSAVQQFTVVKNQYKPVRIPKIVIQRTSEAGHSLEIPITPELVEKCYEPVLEGAKELIDKTITKSRLPKPRRRILSLTGGGSQNNYLYSCLKEVYTKRGIEVLPQSRDQYGLGDKSVVMGAVGRFDLGRIPVDVELQHGYGFAQDMTYDAEKHVDLPEDSNFVYIQEYDNNEKFVDDRWQSLVRPGVMYDRNDSEPLLLNEVRQEYLLAEDDRLLQKQIFYHTCEIKDGSYIYKTHKNENEGGQLVDGLQPWGHPVTCEVPLEDLQKYKKVWPKGARGGNKTELEPRSQAICALRVMIQGLKVDIEWCLVPTRVHLR